MKKILYFFAAFLAFASISPAAVQITFNAGEFLDKSGLTLQSGKAVFLVDTSGGNFENFTIDVGDILSAGSYTNVSNNYYVLFTAGLTNDGGGSYIVDSQFQQDSVDPSLNGMNIALLFLDVDDATSYNVILYGTDYCFFTPQMAESLGITGPNSLSFGDDWSMIASGIININVLSESYGFYIPNNLLQTSSTVIPEPATLAAIFGGLALFLALAGRKRK